MTLQNVYDYVEDFLDSDEWMEDDLMLPSSAAASSHDGLKSPPPYSHQSALTDFGITPTVSHVSHICCSIHAYTERTVYWTWQISDSYSKNKWSKNFDERPHRRRIFYGEKFSVKFVNHWARFREDWLNRC